MTDDYTTLDLRLSGYQGFDRDRTECRVWFDRLDKYKVLAVRTWNDETEEWECVRSRVSDDEIWDAMDEVEAERMGCRR